MGKDWHTKLDDYRVHLDRLGSSIEYVIICTSVKRNYIIYMVYFNLKGCIVSIPFCALAFCDILAMSVHPLSIIYAYFAGSLFL